jgi:hypothetical protein
MDRAAGFVRRRPPSPYSRRLKTPQRLVDRGVSGCAGSASRVAAPIRGLRRENDDCQQPPAVTKSSVRMILGGFALDRQGYVVTCAT